MRIFALSVITPLLIRLVYYYILKKQRVARLCRRKNGLPWYNAYESSEGTSHDKFITAIRSGLPEELRPIVIAMDTPYRIKVKTKMQ